MRKNGFVLWGFLLSIGSPIQAKVIVNLGAKVVCSSRLAERALSPVGIAKFRYEIYMADSTDSEAPRERAQISRLSNDLNADVDQKWEVPVDIGTHVISLGSGPDVYRLLYHFPFAYHYHLFDSMNGWGKGPAEVYSEIEARLGSIHPQAKVERIREGFLRYRPNLQEAGPWIPVVQGGNTVDYNYYQLPVVWKVSWESPAAGKCVRYFYLHALDYNKILAVKAALSSIPKNDLGGLLITGAKLPEYHASMVFFSRLKTGGFFLAELNHRNAEGKAPSPTNPNTLKKLQRDFEVLYHHDCTQEERVNHRPYFLPETFLFLKKQ